MYEIGTTEWDENYARMVEDRRQTIPQPWVVGTPEWVSEMEKKIQNDEQYKQAAKAWEGSLVLVFKGLAEIGLNRDIFIFMDLWHGECHSVRIVPPEMGRTGEYVLEAPYERWKKIMRKELNVVKEIATMKLKLVPFSIKKAAKLAAATQAAIRLVDLAGDVSDRFPDELGPEDFDAYKSLFIYLNETYGI